jgi:hypothetical protein
MREQLALSLFRAEKAAKASAEAQLEAARQEIARLTDVAATESQGEGSTSPLTPLPVAADVLAALRERVEVEHDDATHWPKGSTRDGHQGEFVTCPHDDCVLSRAESAEAQVDAIRQQIAELEARLK